MIAHQFVASKNLKHFETLLETNARFFRVHKSWVINKDFLQTYSKSELSIQLSNGLISKLSKYKKAEFEAAIIAWIGLLMNWFGCWWTTLNKADY